ncbi:MAG: hypothetical protein JWP30_85 [Homoserinimonas sp.]|jgi:hypothetical protein|nr:hypothetical protein [Homoserinimonas sp.]
MTTLLAIAYWAALFIFAIGSLLLAVLAWTRKTLWIIASSAVFLGVALVIAALPRQGGNPAASISLTIIAIAIAVVGGGPATTATLRLATRDSVKTGQHGGIIIASEPQEVLRGGQTIGLLERLATVGALVAGFPAALAVIVAIKGVGRFTELDAAEARERFIIGTFVSLIWACAAAMLPLLAG